MTKRKILSLVLAILMVATSVVALVGCDPDEESGVTIDGIVITKMPTAVYEVGEAPAVGGMEVSADWSDSLRTTLRSNQYTTNAASIDKSSAGVKRLEVTLVSDSSKTASVDLLYVSAGTTVVSPTKVSVYVSGDAAKTEITSKKLAVGDTLQLAGEVEPSNANHKAFVWSSTNPKAVSVTSGGLVTGVKQGMADIIATSADGNRHSYVRVLVEDSSAPATYTNRSYMETFSTNWNPHTWELGIDQDIMNNVVAGFYTTQVNQARDAYDWIPQMAAALPEDVTSQYAARFGLSETATGHAWKVALNRDAKWQNGEPITADDYLYSLQAVLDPAMANRRQDSYTANEGEIVGAKAYYNANRTIRQIAPTEADFDSAEHVYYSLSMPLIYGYSLAALNGSYNLSLELSGGRNFGELYSPAAGESHIEITADIKDQFYADYLEIVNRALIDLFEAPVLSEAEWAADSWNFVAIDYTYPATSFDDVGIVKVDDYTLVYVYVTSLTRDDAMLYLDGALVHEETYERYKSTTSSTYNTSKETTMSYGPYMIDSFSPDQQIVFVRNPYWFGWSQETFSAENHLTSINIVKRTAESAEAEFKQGNLDSLTLTQPMVDGYKNSSRLLYTQDSGYVNRLMINYSMESLTEIDKGNGYYTGANQEANTRVLTSAYFREALFYSLDRSSMTNAATAGEMPAIYLLGGIYYYNMTDAVGTLHRESEAGKKVVVDFFGVRYVGDGKGPLNGATEYADLDTAVTAATNMAFDVERSKQLYTQAYEDLTKEGAVFAGGITGDVKFSIAVGGEFLSNTDLVAPYQAAIQNGIDRATAGTPFANKIKITCVAQGANGTASRYNLVSGQDAGKKDIALAIGALGSALMRPEYILQNISKSNGEAGHYGQGFDAAAVYYEFDVNGDGEIADFDLNGDGKIETSTTGKIETEANGIKETHPDGKERLSVEAWANALNAGGIYAGWKPGSPNATAEQNTKFIEMTAKLELELLRSGSTIPISAIATRSLLSFRLETALAEQHPQFNRLGTWSRFTDAEWTAFVNANKDASGNLNYTD